MTTQLGLIAVVLTLASTPALAQRLGIGTSDGVPVVNPDGSVTIREPALARGRERIRVRQGADGICAIFGYNRYLPGTAKDDLLAVDQTLVALEDDGSVRETVVGHDPYAEIICYNEGTLKVARYAREIQVNLDRSVTLVEPELLRGGERLAIRAGGEGACALFGFNSYLERSGRDLDLVMPESLAVLKDDGAYVDTVQGRDPYAEVTCYQDPVVAGFKAIPGVVIYGASALDPAVFLQLGIQPIQRLADPR